MKKDSKNPHLSLNAKINKTEMQDLKNRGKLSDTNVGSDCVDMIPKAQATEAKLDKRDYTSNSETPAQKKKTTEIANRQKILSRYLYNKELIS